MMRFILPIVMLLTSLGLFLGYVVPGYTDVQTLRAEVAQYDSALSKARELQRIRDELNRTYEAFPADDLNRLTALLPDRVDNTALALNLDTIALQHGIKISSFDLTKEEEGAEEGSAELNLYTALVTFEAQGSYLNLVSFLKDLERNVRLVDITELQFTEESKGLSTYAVTLRIYWLK